MAYVKKTWEVKTFQKGDQEMIAGLNHMEEGIAEGSGSSDWVEMMRPAMKVNDDNKVEILKQTVMDANVTIDGNVYNTNGFLQTNQLKANVITFFDTPVGEDPAVKIVNADLVVGTTESQKTIYLNGKAFPAHPASTGTFVLKCVDGVLTWVAE